MRVAGICLGLFAAACGRPVTPASAVEPLGSDTAARFAQERVAPVVGEHLIPGAVLAVVQGGRVILQQGYGTADLASGRPVRSDRTLFRVASVSKLFTAAAVLRLVQAGRLDLDCDVNRYLKGIRIEPAFDHPITLHNLLTHTDGFDVRRFHTAARASEQRLLLRQYLEQFQPERVRPPGLVDSYDNYGFTLAGYLVQKVTGQPFARHVQEALLEPLGMGSSSFQPEPTLRARLATGYWLHGSHFEAYPRDQVNILPAAGLCATGGDMARFMIALLDGKPPGAATGLAPSVRHALLTPQFRVDQALPGRCYGFNQILLSGRRALRQTGSWPGYESVVLLFPRQDTGLFLAYNLTDHFSFGRGICRSFAERFIPRPAPGPATNNAPWPDKEEVQRLAGIYVATRYPHHEPMFGPQRELHVQARGTGLTVNGQPFRCLGGKVYGRARAAKGTGTGTRSERLAFWPEDVRIPTYLVTDRASYRRAAWWETNTGSQAGLTCILVVLLSGGIWWLLAGSLRGLAVLCRLKRPPLASGQLTRRWPAAAAKGLALFACGFAAWYLLALAQATAQLAPLADLYGPNDELRNLLRLGPALGVLSLALLACAGWVWRLRAWNLGERILYSLVTLSLLLLCLGLHQRNLLP